MVIRHSNPQSQVGYDSNFLSELIGGDQKARYSSRSQLPELGKKVNFGAFLKLEQQYKKDFI